MARRRNDSLIFDSIRLEGGLFVPAVLEQIALGEHPSQTAAAYRLPKGLSLVDEQGRAFRIAGALWKAFQPVSERADIPAHRATIGFVTELLRDAFGYVEIAAPAAPIELTGRAYPVTLMSGGCVPVIVAPHDLELDTPDERFAVIGSGSRRKSAYQLAQQFLNASDAATWALVTNGRQLRLIRDADTLTRPTFLEIDLDLILREARYPDFAAVWRILHVSRATEPASGEDCAWEKWRKEGQAQGERVRDGLREGVTRALIELGSGFLQHPHNQSLRDRLEHGELSVDAYFQQLLRLVYRFLFVFTVEERGLLHPLDDAPESRDARRAYADGYALRRLRDRALRHSSFDRFHDLWDGIRIVFRGLASGEPRLALPALGGLFKPTQCPDLDACRLENRALLTAMRQLRWSRASGQMAVVDYRNMGPEELGSVYESLLELVPAVDLPTRNFGFVGITDEGSTDGNARKTSGSYYTPDSLVQQLLDSALEPVIRERLAAAPDAPVRALLGISVIDPACGSGHFLLGAARRLAERLAELRAVEGAVQPADYRHALREVIAHCIYGVDRNPLALELARTALWLEGFEPGQPLSFLDHHLVCGDALLGYTDFAQIADGIPNDAFKPLAGDDPATCRDLAARNRAALKELKERRKGPSLFADTDVENVFARISAIEAMPDDSPAAVAAKEQAYAAFLKSARDSNLAIAANLAVAAFLAPKPASADLPSIPTTQSLIDVLFPLRDTPRPEAAIAHAQRLCAEARVLHWPLAFAQIFGRGGFDCVLGNPPWERIKIQEKEFFAARHAGIATAQNKALRDRLISGLRTGSEADRRLYAEFDTARRFAEAMSVFAHVGAQDNGRFPLTGVGDVNTYALFAESISQITASGGYSGFIVPTGIATDDSTKRFFASLVQSRRLVSLFDFENREGIFQGVHRSYKFCLITLGRAAEAVFAFFLTRTEQLDDDRRKFSLSAEDFRLINPNTLTCPVFRSKADAELTKKIYRRVPVLIREASTDHPEENPWGISFSTMFHMSGDSGCFLSEPAAGTLPLYEAKMMHQFDHRWASYAWDAERKTCVASDVPLERKQDPHFEVTPRYWVAEREVLARIARVPRSTARAWSAQDPAALLAAFANWIEAAHADDPLAGFHTATPRQRVIDAAGPLFNQLPQNDRDWLDKKAVAEARAADPLSPAELQILRSASDIDAAAHAILDLRSPQWLMGWRDITNSTNERTVIASVIPRAAVGDTLLLMYPTIENKSVMACLLADQNSLVHDFVARQKVGGTHLKFHVKKQIACLPPSQYAQADIAFILPRVLELTYTSEAMRPWARDLGYDGDPFPFDPDRRALLRAELDACYARLYGLTRDELRYILDPADTHGDDYPSETFRGLKANEIKAHGEYRTQRLVLEAWDRMHATGPDTAN